MRIAGFVLLILGVLGLVYGGFRYTTRESVIDVGPIHASADVQHSVPVAPIVGVVLLLGGAGLLVGGRRAA